MTLVWLAIAFVLGIYAGSSVSLGSAPLFLAAAVVTLALVAAWRRPPVRLSSLLAICFLLGAGRAESARLHIGPGDIGYYNGQAATLTGYVNTEPDIRDTGNNYVITVDHMFRGRGMVPVDGQIEMHTSPSQILNEGDEIQVTGLLLTPTNSSTVPYRSILANRGIYTELSFPKIFVTGQVSLGIVGVADRIRQWIENSLSASLPEPEATFLIAIVIGARSAQLGNLAPVLIQTGLIHLIAISGIKIAIVAGTVSGFVRRMFSRTPALLTSVAVLASYWLVSGATVAGLRSSIMWLLVFTAAYLGRPTYALVSLAAAISAMLAISPQLLWDTGFQLTAVGTASIVAFTPLIERVTNWLPGFLAASVNTTMAAQVGVLPIQIASFHVVGPLSLLTNAIVLPFIPLTMLVGFLVAALPQPPIVAIAYALVHVLILTARWAQRLSGALRLSSLPLLVTLSYYGILIALATFAWRLRASNSRRRRGEWLFGFSVAAVGLALVATSAPSRDGIYFITKGDALIISQDQHVLIDGGASGAKLLVGLSEHLQFPNDRLDLVIDTSPEAKNVAALLEVAQHTKIGAVLDPGMEYPSQTYGRWRSWLKAHDIPVMTLRSGALIKGSRFDLRAVAPDALYPNPKDGAGILLIEYGSKRILYLGDASTKEQEDLPFLENRLESRTIISSVPIDPILARATGYRELIRPQSGRFVALGRSR